MSIERIKGNIWNTKATTIVNTVNCEGIMGAGIALECRLRYPNMYIKYKELCDKGLLKPGLLWLYKNEPFNILNFPTKNLWRLPSKEEYLHSGLLKFKQMYKIKNISSIAFPLLGASNGGISIDRSFEIMSLYLSELDIPIEIYDYDPNSPDDLFAQFKAQLESCQNNLIELSKETKISRRYLELLVEEVIKNGKFCQMNQLLSISGIGINTLEKLFIFFANNRVC